MDANLALSPFPPLTFQSYKVLPEAATCPHSKSSMPVSSWPLPLASRSKWSPPAWSVTVPLSGESAVDTR